MGMPNAKKCVDCENNDIRICFETIESYNCHRKLEHSNTGLIGDAYKCNNCGLYFDTKTALSSHISISHP